MPMRNLTALSLLAALLPLSPYGHGAMEDAVDVLAAGRLSAVSIGALSTNRTSTVALEASADVSADLSVAGTASFARGVARLPPAPGLPMGAHTNVGHAAEGTPRPAWWTELGVLDPSAEPNDFALAVQGQVKWIASRAAHGLGEAGALAGGSGPACSALAAAFTPSNNALPVTLGQLKATAAPFWARLAELAPSSAPPPWAGEAAPQDFALVNVGQVKAAFSFELPPPLDPEADEDGDGMPNGWEMSYGLDPLDRFDVCDDPDGDGIPNVYEYHHGLDPRVDDADFLEKIVVGGDAPGAVPTLKAAFAASRPYSVIEIAPGAYQGSGWTRLWFPEHPVLVTSPDGGRNRQVVIRDVGSGTCATFYLAARQTVHTVVQGIYLDLASTDGLQMGFWCGGNLPWSGTPAAGMFRNVYIRMSKPGVDYMGWFFRHWESNEVVIAGCTLNAAGATRARGIYAVDSPPMSVENCSFLRFPRAESPNLGYGIQYETTEQNWSGAPDPIPLEIVNCLFDGSFTNAYALAPLEMGVEYDVTMLNCLVPSPLEYEADHVGNLLVTNALVAFSGHLASDSPAIGAGAPVLYSHLDLDGQDRDAWPDIGADECIPLDASLDTDGDGLTDMVEIGQTNTDPFLLDTDGDGVDDRTEIAQGTDPTDPRSFLQTLTVAVTNAVALANVTNYVAWGFSPTDWEANGLAAVTGTGRSVVYTNASTVGAAYVKCFRDLDRNGVYDADRDIFLVRAIPSGGVARLVFSFGDVDGDNVPDHVERAEGTDPYDAKNHRFNLSMTFTDIFSTTNALTAEVYFGTNRWAGPFVMTTNVWTFADGFTVSNGEAVVFYFWDDANSNGVREAWETTTTNRYSANRYEMTVSHRLPYGGFDRDRDNLPDWWELSRGLSIDGSPADEYADPDGDGLVNLHEFWAGTDPLTPDGSNTLLSVMARSVDDRIAGRDPAASVSRFNDFHVNGSNGVFSANSGFWLGDVDVSCASVWHSGELPGEKPATLITRRHVILSRHWYVENGLYTFCDTNGLVVARSLISTRDVSDDIRIGRLDEPLPESFTPVKILPADFADYLVTGKYLPAVSISQDKDATILELLDLNCTASGHNRYGATSSTNLVSRQRCVIRAAARDGNSGTPVFLLVGNELVFLFAKHLGWRGVDRWSPFWGPMAPLRLQEIQSRINDWEGDNAHLYPLNLFDLRSFDRISKRR